jgi:hypothetical protein
MATHTTYYNLTKPSANDKVNIDVLNNNADIIDEALHNKVNSDDLTANNIMMSDGVTSVEEVLSYSETEHVVGKWIDGSTLYEKTINFGALPNTAPKQVSAGVSNVNVVDIKGVN